MADLPTLGILSEKHPRWDEFVSKLWGYDMLTNPAGESRWTGWGDNDLADNCDHSRLCPITRQILAEMGATASEMKATLNYFRSRIFVPLCDCVIATCSDHTGAYNNAVAAQEHTAMAELLRKLVNRRHHRHHFS